jgi:ATP synthase protein I
MSGDQNDGLEERRKQLAEKLARLKTDDEADTAKEKSAGETRKGMALGLKISSEFISAIIVGALLGYLLDLAAGTSPWGLIFFLLIGFCAGVLNVLRSTGVVAKAPYDELSDRK